MAKNTTTPSGTKCNARISKNNKARAGGLCKKPAGWGTDHLGIGRCRHHGGAVPSGRANAAKQRAILMGAPKEINPVDALYWCIKITAGEVEWLSDQIATLEQKDWYENTVLGRQMHVLVRERKEAVTRLAGFSKDALSLGLAERAVRLAENYGVALSNLLKGVLDDLILTPEQQKIAPSIVRKHLILLEGGKGRITPEEGGPVRSELKVLTQKVESDKQKRKAAASNGS